MRPSKLLLQLIDEAILPAVLVLSVKIGSLLLLIYFFNLSFTITAQAVWPMVQFTNPKELLLANSYSNLFTLAVVVLGLLWVLVKAQHFHDTHISPGLTLKLLAWDFRELISSSWQIYPQALIWLSYLWLAVAMMTLHAFLGLSYAWLTVIGFVVAVFLTSLFIWDLEKEVY